MERAIERSAITKYDIIMELKAMAFCNMEDFLRKGYDGRLELSNGYPILDLSAAGSDKLKSIKEIIVEEYVDGIGAVAREVKKMRVVLHDKRAPLLDLAKMMGMVKPPSITQNNDNRSITIVMTEDEILASR